MEKWTKGETLRFKNARWETAFRAALLRRDGARLELSLPYSPQKPFPLSELMCFARWERIEGQERIIYAFGEDQTPIF